jgi:hypothetical protein
MQLGCAIQIRLSTDLVTASRRLVHLAFWLAELADAIAKSKSISVKVSLRWDLRMKLIPVRPRPMILMRLVPGPCMKIENDE